MTTRVNSYYNPPGTAPENINQLLWGVLNGSDPQGTQVTTARDAFSAARDPVYQQAAKALGITNINSANDLDQLNRLIFGGGYSNGAATAGNGGTGGSTGGGGGGTGGPGNTGPNASGTYDGIIGALGQQGQAGLSVAEQQRLETEQLQNQLAVLQFQNQQAVQAFQQSMAQQYMQQQQQSQAMAQQMMAQQVQAAQAGVAQANAAMAAAAEQRQQAENLARAYVPPPKETVGFAPIGDLRSPVAASRQNSQLSDLSFASNPGGSLLNTLILA
jgi:hypothetical protein